MAGPYYCDLAADFVDRTGVDSTTNVYTGPGGFQAAVRGTGNATALAAGEILYLKGTATLCRLVLLRCGKDVSSWSVGDTVVDNNTGSEWSGKVCQVNVGAVNTDIIIQTDSAYEQNDITLGSGINNTTAVDTTTLATKTCEGILIDGADGNATSGRVILQGTTDLSSPTTNLGQAILEATSAGTNATNCLAMETGVDAWSYNYLTFQNAVGDGFEGNTKSHKNNKFNHCLAQNNGGHGFDLHYSYTVTVHTCIARSNGGTGFYSCFSSGVIVHSVASGNSGDGIFMWQMATLWGCLCYENTGDNISLRSGASTQLVANCVAADSSGGSGIKFDSVLDDQRLIANRVTGNNQYGIEGAANSLFTMEDWNVIEGNGVAARLNVAAGPNSDDSPADDGFVNSASDDYNIKTGAEIRSTALTLNWDV